MWGRRHEHAGEPRVARIAFEIVKQKGSCADHGIGVIESDEHDRYTIDVRPLEDPGRPRSQRLAGIEMPHSAKPQAATWSTNSGRSTRGTICKRYSAAFRFTAAERPRSVAIS